MTAPTHAVNYTTEDAAAEFIANKAMQEPCSDMDIRCTYLGRSIVYIPTSSTLIAHDFNTEEELGGLIRRLSERSVHILHKIQIKQWNSQEDLPESAQEAKET